MLGRNNFFLGCYSIEREKMEYNKDYVAFLKDRYGYAEDDDNDYEYLGPSVIKMFDVKKKEFVQGTSSQLLDIYYKNFENPNKNENNLNEGKKETKKTKKRKH